MIDIKRLRHLVAVTTYPTVQAAAESLHITQSALTKSIARFEDELEAPLFDRTGHRLSPTELGERLAERGTALMRQVHTLEEEIALWKGLGTGEINIGVDPTAEFGLLPEVLETFVPAHPGISISLRSGHTETLLPALLEGELHFVLADPELAQDDENLDIRELVSSPLAAAVRPNHPLAKYTKAIPTPEQLRLYPRIGAATAPRFDRWQEERAQREGAGPISRSLVSDNYSMLIGLAEKIDAIVFGPCSLLKSYEKQKRLVVVPWPLEGPETQTSLIHIRARHLPPAAERLIERVLDSVSLNAQHS